MCILYSAAFTQAKSGLENYNFLSQGKEYVWMPIIHYQTKKGIYSELRYNYEDVKTLSLYGGKTFAGGNDLQFNVTPMLGFSLGKFSGISLAGNTEIEWKNFYLSSQMQYSMATKRGENNFFFNWSEVGYNIMHNFFAGLAIQYTRQQNLNDLAPGFVAGLSFKNVSFPFYMFNPFQPGRYFVWGVNYEYRF